jgi:alpha-tubulin suppressor-like RCC1 family protein
MAGSRGSRFRLDGGRARWHRAARLAVLATFGVFAALGAANVVATSFIGAAPAGPPAGGSTVYGKHGVIIGVGSNIQGPVAAEDGTLGSNGRAIFANGTGRITGDARSGGNVGLGNGGAITGTLTRLTSSTLTLGSGATVGVDNTYDSIGFPGLASPTLITCPTGGADHTGANSQSLTLTPGTYGNVSYGSTFNLTLYGAGNYVFQSLHTANGATINIPVPGVHILICDAAVFGSVSVLPLSLAPSAFSVEAHSADHGVGGDWAFRGTGGSNWIGDVFAPNGGIHFGGSGCCSSFVGHLLAQVVDFQGSVTGTTPTPTPTPTPTTSPTPTPTPSPSPSPTPTPSGPPSQTIYVPGNVAWYDTGIDVPPGAGVQFDATGRVSVAGSDPNGKDPAGAVGCDSPVVYSPPFLVPGLTCWSLIGRIGTGDPFEIGDAVATLSAAGGRLYLSMDDNFFDDNSGTWIVLLTLWPGGILPPETSIALASSANPATQGSPVTFSATVTAGSGTPTGLVNFMDGLDVLGEATLDASGVAQVTATALPAGSQNIRATYRGNNLWRPSTSALLAQDVVAPTGSPTPTPTPVPTPAPTPSPAATPTPSPSPTPGGPSGGQAYAWGQNYFGTLGTGGGDSLTPAPVSGAGNAIAIGAEGSSAVMLRADGTMAAWGYNVNGQLGTGDYSSSATPVNVIGLPPIGSLCPAFGQWNAAVATDGSVWTWGINQFGQLGHGTIGGNNPNPAPVTGLSGVQAATCRGSHAVAIRDDGTLVAWGHNGYGSLGDGTTTDRSLPVPVIGLTNVRSVASFDSSFAIRTDGSVWSWGWNASGQLGDGTTTNRSVPGQIPGLANIVAVSEASDWVLALGADGSIWSWGSNAYGQLGDGTTFDRHAPAQISGPSDVVAVSAGQWHGLALRSNGTVIAWGRNSEGQLGDGTTSPHLLPAPVPCLSDVTAIDANTFSSYAIGTCAGS